MYRVDLISAQLNCSAYSNAYYLTEISNTTNPMFNIFKKNKSFNSHNVVVNATFSKDFIMYPYFTKTEKANMLFLWFIHTTKISEDDKNKLKRRISWLNAVTPQVKSRESVLGERFVTTSFDIIFQPSRNSLKQIETFMLDLLNDEFIIILNLPLFFDLIANKTSKTSVGTSYYATLDIGTLHKEEVARYILTQFEAYMESNFSTLTEEIYINLWGENRFEPPHFNISLMENRYRTCQRDLFH